MTRTLSHPSVRKNQVGKEVCGSIQSHILSDEIKPVGIILSLLLMYLGFSPNDPIDLH